MIRELLINYKKYYNKKYRKKVENKCFKKIFLYLINFLKPVEIQKKISGNFRDI